MTMWEESCDEDNVLIVHNRFVERQGERRETS